MKPWEFGRMTVAELNIVIDSYNDKLADDLVRLRYLAWWTASMTRAKKIPQLRQLISNKEKEDKPIEVKREEHQKLIEKLLKARDNNA